jgi:HAE1 family hydrophobic/amphiphilic exporter-1
MMTTMAALMGTLPIALGYGAGGEARRPMGLAVVGGLLVSQVITLYITPVYFTYLESFQQWVRGIFRGRRRAPVQELAPVLNGNGLNGNSVPVEHDLSSKSF